MGAESRCVETPIVHAPHLFHIPGVVVANAGKEPELVQLGRIGPVVGGGQLFNLLEHGLHVLSSEDGGGVSVDIPEKFETTRRVSGQIVDQPRPIEGGDQGGG